MSCLSPVRVGGMKRKTAPDAPERPSADVMIDTLFDRMNHQQLSKCCDIFRAFLVTCFMKYGMQFLKIPASAMIRETDRFLLQVLQTTEILNANGFLNPECVAVRRVPMFVETLRQAQPTIMFNHPFWHVMSAKQHKARGAMLWIDNGLSAYTANGLHVLDSTSKHEEDVEYFTTFMYAAIPLPNVLSRVVVQYTMVLVEFTE